MIKVNNTISLTNDFKTNINNSKIVIEISEIDSVNNISINGDNNTIIIEKCKADIIINGDNNNVIIHTCDNLLLIGDNNNINAQLMACTVHGTNNYLKLQREFGDYNIINCFNSKNIIDCSYFIINIEHANNYIIGEHVIIYNKCVNYYNIDDRSSVNIINNCYHVEYCYEQKYVDNYFVYLDSNCVSHVKYDAIEIVNKRINKMKKQ